MRVPLGPSKLFLSDKSANDFECVCTSFYGFGERSRQTNSLLVKVRRQLLRQASDSLPLLANSFEFRNSIRAFSFGTFSRLPRAKPQLLHHSLKRFACCWNDR